MFFVRLEESTSKISISNNSLLPPEITVFILAGPTSTLSETVIKSLVLILLV